jgi:uncharacterized protein
MHAPAFGPLLWVAIAAAMAMAAPRARAQERPVVCGGGTSATAMPFSEAAPRTSACAEPAPTRVRWADVGLSLAVLALGGGGIAYVRANERRRRERELPATRIDVVPYATGAALGVLVTVSLAVFAQPLGISGGVQNLAGSVGLAITPDNRYWGHAIPVGATWSAWVVVGVLAGALAAAVSAGSFSLRAVPEGEWVPWRRWAAAFVAATIIELGAAIAGGCTSGLALSGGVVLAPGAFVFMAAMFAAGVPTAFWLDRPAADRVRLDGRRGA